MRWFVALAFSLLSLSSQAHQLNAAVTTVLFNPRSGQLEIMHKFFVHDAEHALRHLHKEAGAAQQHGSVDLLQNEQNRAEFADYVATEFELQWLYADGSKAVSLTLVGAEVDGNNLWVYQEASPDNTAIGLKVRQNSLQQFWAKQVNLVNIERDGQVRSLQFRKGQSWQQLLF
ncbi:DUF6702 family protein [Rheinheimera marina]|uniref:DUF6702 family protein n=1 Tax=Rheinheimera marina TaxID=1774958 RepID=A0ABV9JQB5_9GAMM